MGWRHKRDPELFVPIAPRYHPSAVLAAPPLRGRRSSPLEHLWLIERGGARNQHELLNIPKAARGGHRIPD